MDDSKAPRAQAEDTLAHVAGAIPSADTGIASHWSGIIAWVSSPWLG
jgi:hypothetical protein